MAKYYLIGLFRSCDLHMLLFGKGVCKLDD